MPTFADPLARAMQIGADRTATIFDDRVVSFRELASRCARLGAALRKLGLGTGDRVAILSANSDRYIRGLPGGTRCRFRDCSAEYPARGTRASLCAPGRRRDRAVDRSGSGWPGGTRRARGADARRLRRPRCRRRRGRTRQVRHGGFSRRAVLHGWHNRGLQGGHAHGTGTLSPTPFIS